MSEALFVKSLHAARPRHVSDVAIGTFCARGATVLCAPRQNARLNPCPPLLLAARRLKVSELMLTIMLAWPHALATQRFARKFEFL